MADVDNSNRNTKDLSAAERAGWLRYSGFAVVVLPDERHFECLSVAQQGPNRQSPLYQCALAHSLIRLMRHAECRNKGILPSCTLDFAQYGCTRDEFVRVAVENPVSRELEHLLCWLLHFVPTIDENIENGDDHFQDSKNIQKCATLYGKHMVTYAQENDIDVVIVLGSPLGKNPYLLSARW